MKQINKSAFTLAELVVVSVILIILGAIGFVSFSDNIPNARDSERKSSIAKIQSSLKLYKEKRGSYPLPGDYFDINNGVGTTIASQGKLNEKVALSTLDTLPVDPKIDMAYSYSTTINRQEFQIAGTLENIEGNEIAILAGDYKSVSKNIAPTIMFATGSSIQITTSGSGLFIVDGGYHNLPYTFQSPFEPYTDNSTLSDIFNDPNINFWQNSDYRTCIEIKEASKSIGDGEYQVLSNTGMLTNTGFTSM